jgi:hypothetical protein
MHKINPEYIGVRSYTQDTPSDLLQEINPADVARRLREQVRLPTATTTVAPTTTQRRNYIQ